MKDTFKIWGRGGQALINPSIYSPNEHWGKPRFLFGVHRGVLPKDWLYPLGLIHRLKSEGRTKPREVFYARSFCRPKVEPFWDTTLIPRPKTDPVDALADLLRRLDARNLPRDNVFDDRRIYLHLCLVEFTMLDQMLPEGEMLAVLGLRGVEIEL